MGRGIRALVGWTAVGRVFVVLMTLCLLTMSMLVGTQAVGTNPAHAETVVDQAATGLETDRLYVAPGTRQLRGAAQSEVRAHLRTTHTAVFVAVLPTSAEDEVWGDATRLPAALYEQVLQPGTYVVLVGGRLVANSTKIGESASRMAEQASDGVAADSTGALLGLIDDIDRAASAPNSSTTTDSPRERGFPWGLLFVTGLVGFGYLLVRRKRDRMGAEMSVVSGLARDDLMALGEDLAKADPEIISGPGGALPQGPDPVSGSRSAASTIEAATFHQRGLDAFDRAKHALIRAREPDDLAAVSRAIAEGRLALSSSRAAAAGSPLPQRRAPCFYDPGHGPSATDSRWVAPDGQRRLVPVCDGCADRLARGDSPEPRTVPVGRQWVPYWDSGPSYAGWVGGYYQDYAECRLSQLLQGTELGSALTDAGSRTSQ